MLTSRSNVSASRALFLVLALAATPALAKKRVVVLNFAGPQGKKAQAAVAAQVKKAKYVIIPQAAFAKTAKSLHISRPTDDDVANVARKLKADAIVAGIVQKQKKKFELVVTVRDGGNGTVLERVTIPLKGGKIDKKASAQIASDVIPIIDRAGGASAVAAAAPEPTSDKASGDGESPFEKKDKKADTTMPAAAPVDDPTASAMGAKPAKSDSSSDASASATASAPGVRAEWRPLVTAAFTVGGTGRSLTFDGLPAGSNLQGYSGGLVAAMGLDVYSNPLGNSASAAKNLGLYFTLEKVLSISSTFTSGATKTQLDSSELHFTLGAEYNYRLHETPDSITVGGRFGYGLTSFDISVPANLMGMVTVPDVDYKYLELGPFVKIPFEAAGSWWEILARFSYLPVLDAGQITAGGRSASIAVGNNGGASGIELALGATWHVKPWLNALAGFRLDRFGISFDQGAAAQSASDLYYNLGLGIGVVY